MRIDDNLHAVFKSLNDVKWNEFKDEMFDEYEKMHECYHYYEYYYAEKELYVIRHILTHEIYFTKARSPYSAYINFSANLTESHGHDYKGRDYSYSDFITDICTRCGNKDDCDMIPIMENGEVMTDFRHQCRDLNYLD